MKIKRSLQQFTDENVLLVCASKKDAVIYTASQGVIIKKEQFSLPKRSYSDREGHFQTHHTNLGIRSGSVYENKKHAERKRLYKKAASTVAKITHAEKPDTIYVFIPGHLSKEFRDSLPSRITKHIQKTFRGNYTDSHPFVLLEQIKKYQQDKLVKPMKPEARKLMNKGRKRG